MIAEDCKYGSVSSRCVPLEVNTFQRGAPSSASSSVILIGDVMKLFLQQHLSEAAH